MPNSIDSAMPSTDASIEVMPLALQKNGSSSEWRRQTPRPSGNIMPMQNAGGASNSTDTRMRMSGDSVRAQLVPSGVSNPAATSVASNAATRSMIAPGRGASAPTVVLPMPLNSRMVNSTTLSP